MPAAIPPTFDTVPTLFGHPDSTLKAGTTVGATSFTVHGTPNAKFTNNVILCIGWGANLEVHSCSWDGSRWNTSSLNPLIFAHSSGDPVWWVPDGIISAFWLDDPVYTNNGGIDGKNNWALYQRLFWFMHRESVGVVGVGHNCTFNQNLVVPSNNFYGWRYMRLVQGGGAWLGGAEATTKRHSAVVMTAKYAARVTVNHTTGLFTLPYGDTCAGMQLADDQEIMFSDPFGKGLPGGLNPGVIYYIARTTVGATTFKIAATVGGAVLTFSSDGEGVAYAQISNNDGKQQFDYIRIEHSVTGAQGFHCATQQESSGSHLYIIHNGGTGTYAFFPQGQGMRWDDVIVVPDDNLSSGVLLDGTSLHTFDGYLNIISGFDPVMVVNPVGGDGLVLSVNINKIWCESAGEIQVFGGRDINFGKMYAAHITDHSSGQATWETDYYQGGSGSEPIASDSGGTWSFTGYDGAGADWQGSTTAQFSGPGLFKFDARPPKLKYRGVYSYAGTGARVRQLDELYLLDTTNANPWPLTIPAALIFEGNDWRFRRIGGANAVRVTPAGGHTIDGAATKDFNDNLEHRIYATGGQLITMY